MAERSCYPQSVIDKELFALKMQNLLRKIEAHTLRLSNIQFASILHKVMEMVRVHHVKLAGEYANIFVSILILEGLACS